MSCLAAALAMPYPYPYAMPDDVPSYHPEPHYGAVGRVKIQVRLIAVYLKFKGHLTS